LPHEHVSRSGEAAPVIRCAIVLRCPTVVQSPSGAHHCGASSQPSTPQTCRKPA